jgi:hypothetical protein
MSDTDTTNLTVAAVNDAPTITAPADLPINPTGSRALSAIASLTDVDAGSATLRVTLAVNDGTLTASSGGGVVVANSGTASMFFDGTLANLNAYLGGSNVTFNQDGSPSATVTLTATIDDNGNTGSGGARTANTTITLTTNVVFRDGFE